MIKTHWHILGAGSIGLLWAAKLREAGHQVTLITRQVQPVRPVWLDNQRIAVASSTAKQCRSIDYLLICTKSFQTEQALASVAHAVHENTVLVLLQNGMGGTQPLLQRWPNNPLFAAITTEGAQRVGIMQVKHTGTGQTQIGTLNGSDIAICAHLACGLSLHYQEDIEQALWQKLIINCCINPLTVMFDCLNGALLKNQQALQLIDQLLIECLQVAKAQQREFDANTMRQQIIEVLEKTAHNSSSMREDIRQQRPCEIDAINGFIVHTAQTHGLKAPQNALIVRAIKKRK